MATQLINNVIRSKGEIYFKTNNKIHQQTIMNLKSSKLFAKDLKDNNGLSMMSQDWKTMENSIDLDIRSSDINFKLNDLDSTKTYLIHKQKTGCYKYMSNVGKFERIPGLQDEFLDSLGIKSRSKLTYTEYMKLKNEKYLGHLKMFTEWLGVANEENLEANKKKLNVDHLGYRQMLKRGIRFAHTWVRITYMDFLTYLDKSSFLQFVEDQKNLANEGVSDFNIKSEEVKMGINPSYDSSEVLIDNASGWKYWGTFHWVLNHNPSLWISALNNWCPEYVYREGDKMGRSIMKIIYFIRSNFIEGTLNSQWIESPKGKFRCLCVPEFAYRWYCRMW